MCGIIGISSRFPVANRSWVSIAREVLSHRGPDDGGEWWSADGCVGLGHRRLSIIDLSSTGHQPMLNASGSLCIVFNGEIYNFTDLRAELMEKGHAFHSHTDTEVILAAYLEWGTACLSRMNGMFAFAIYDLRRRMIFLARDRAGEKPLFFHYFNGTLRFASELKALLADSQLSRSVDLDALDCYLSIGYVPGNRCILRGFRKLPPGHALKYDLQSGQFRIWRYWQLPEVDLVTPQRQVTEDILLGELEALLNDAVRLQLVADVPVGVLLSGGVDSSLITAMAAQMTSSVNTFTVRFPGYGVYDETEHARLISRHFGTSHIELDAGHVSPHLLLLLSKQYDEPVVDSSIVPTYLLSKLVRQHCTVVLGGDGGDELFGGYQHYSRLLRMAAQLGRLPLSVRHMLAKVGETLLPLGFKGRNWLQGLGADLQHGLPLIASYFDQDTRKQLMRDDWQPKAEEIYQRMVPQVKDLLERATRMDFENYLAGDILVKVDRASMLNSLEVRSPLLDYRVIEFAFGCVPSKLKATATSRKVILKRLAARLLPPEFDKQRKQGFSIPLGKWLQGGEWLDFFRAILLCGDSIFDRRIVSALFKGQMRGCANSERLFALAMFELWRREYSVTLD
jgi:asparagine synthase (glutamine-hydrolysing)